MDERVFQSKLIKKIKDALPGAVVLKNDPNYIQGIPDLSVFFEDKYAILEVKKSANATHRPNQDYYIEKFSEHAYATFVYPENEEEVLNELQSALRTKRKTRVPKRK